MHFITYEELLELHADALAAYGGQEGVIDSNSVQAALFSPQNELAYGDSTITSVAAAYLVAFATLQGFADGNKRVAASSAITFLAMNGYRLECPDLDLYDIAMRVANKLADKEDVQQWMNERVGPLL